MKRTAVITGASSGIGREFAKELALSGAVDEIYLIGRNTERLKETAESIDLKTECISLDLSTENGIEKYDAIIKERNPEITYLVNAAGFGKFGKYDEIDIGQTAEMINLNCRAVVLMTEKTLPFMKSGGKVIQISSVASFQPLPKANVYAATKAFVTFYGRALNLELKDRGISVTTVCPGWTSTSFFDRACDTKNKKAVTNYSFMMTPQKVAKKALKDAKKGKDISVITLPYKIQHLATKLFPQKVAMKAFLQMQKENKPSKPV